MTTLERSLQGLHRHIVVSTRTNIHELFDANKYGQMLPLPEFTLEFKDPTGNLEFSFHGNHDFWTSRTEEKLTGEILYCQPIDRNPMPPVATTMPRYWRIKVRFMIQFMEHEDEKTSIFVEDVETILEYDRLTKKSKLHEDRFCRKFTRWLEPVEGRIGGGLYFNGRRIARAAEPKPPWEQSKDLPYSELKVGVRAFNAFGRRFQYGTVGDVGVFFDKHTDDEIIRFIGGIGPASLYEMEEELRRLGHQRKK